MLEWVVESIREFCRRPDEAPARGSSVNVGAKQ
jgi:hypothetical protein